MRSRVYSCVYANFVAIMFLYKVYTCIFARVNTPSVVSNALARDIACLEGLTPRDTKIIRLGIIAIMN